MVEWGRNWMFGGIVFAFDFLRISTNPPVLNNVQCQVQSRDEIETHLVPAKETIPKGNEWTCWKLREKIRSFGFWTPHLITQTNLILTKSYSWTVFVPKESENVFEIVLSQHFVRVTLWRLNLLIDIDISWEFCHRLLWTGANNKTPKR